MTTPLRPPKDGIRAMPPGSLQGDGKTLTGRLATGWAEIESVAEGHFMERFAPGAFRRTFRDDRDNIKVLFQHGRDMSVGQQPIAVLEDVGEDADGAYYRAELLDGVPPLILDGLRRGVYGSSHTFRVTREEWETDPKKVGGPHNPKKLPERIVREARVWEFGPVTWPAYAGQALARSMSDEFQLANLTDDPERLRNLVNYIDPDAPSVDAGAEPHLEPERSEAVAPPTTPKKEPTTVPDITEYRTRDEMAARRRELDAEITRMAEIPGVLADPDQADWDAKTEERTALDAAITAWDARVAVAERIAGEKPENTVAYTPPTIVTRRSESDVFDPAVQEPFRYRSTEQWAGAQRDNAMRAAEQAIFVQPNVNQDEARSGVQAMLDNIDTEDKKLARRILATGSPVYRRAFNKLATGQALSSEEQRAASLTVQTDNTGGHLLPFAFDPTMIQTGAWTWINGIRANSSVKQIVGTDTWRGVTVAGVTATRGAESTATTEQGPATEQVEIVANRVSAFVSYSIEMGQDRPDIGSELATLIAQAKDTEEESVFTLGAAAGNDPLGVMPPHGTAGMFTNYDLNTIHTIVAEDLYNMEAALPIRFRQNAVWLAGRAIIRAFQALENDGGQLFGGNYYQSVSYPRNSVVGATGLELLRYPIIEAPSAVVAYAAAGDDEHTIAFFGDLKAGYVVVDRIGMSVEFIPHIFDHAAGSRPLGVRGLYAYWRNGASVVNVDAGRLMMSSA